MKSVDKGCLQNHLLCLMHVYLGYNKFSNYKE